MGRIIFHVLYAEGKLVGRICFLYSQVSALVLPEIMEGVLLVKHIMFGEDLARQW